MTNRLQHSNLRDQALEVLKLRLVSGDLAPGEIYSAASLATELGVSNSPVREAMLALVNQGLMETVKNRGFRVIPLSKRELGNIYDLRVMIEIPAMVRLAERHQDVAEHAEEFTEIANDIVRYAEAGDIVNYLDADRNFHLKLLELLDNEHLVSIVANLRDQSRQYGLKSLSERGVLVKSAEEHEPILKAVLKGDKTLVTKLMGEHLEHVIGDWAG